uniref:Uncharacterized protein n=1 Tax=Fagus sylvatica TaxID=28930 RepID=A0A2N9IKY3_FAGSY
MEGVGANGDIVGVNEVVVLGGTCGDVGVIELGVGACANCDGGGDDKAFLGCGNSGDVCGGEVRVGGNGGKGGNLGLGTGDNLHGPWRWRGNLGSVQKMTSC